MGDFYGEDEEAIVEYLNSMNAVLGPLDVGIPSFEFFGVTIEKYVAIAVLVVFAMLTLYLAFISEIHSYWNLLFLELSSGFAFFAVAPVVVRAGQKYSWAVPLGGLITALLGLAAGYYCETLIPGVSRRSVEFIQAVLIEYSAALLLLVALETVISPWLKSLDARRLELKRKLEQHGTAVPIAPGR
jgi:hypothetical protein